jgi:hypothetical protein
MDQPQATGMLDNTPGAGLGAVPVPTDPSDTWTVDLKVPPFKGYVGQDWPAGCPVLDANPAGTDLGCDLWIEVTGIR